MTAGTVFRVTMLVTPKPQLQEVERLSQLYSGEAHGYGLDSGPSGIVSADLGHYGGRLPQIGRFDGLGREVTQHP